MSLGRKLNNMAKDFMNDPKGHFYRSLKAILNTYNKCGVSKKEVLKYVQDWADE